MEISDGNKGLNCFLFSLSARWTSDCQGQSQSVAGVLGVRTVSGREKERCRALKRCPSRVGGKGLDGVSCVSGSAATRLLVKLRRVNSQLDGGSTRRICPLHNSVCSAHTHTHTDTLAPLQRRRDVCFESIGCPSENAKAGCSFFV